MLGVCRAPGCGKTIKYVKTERGANRPCDSRGVWIVPDPEGPDEAFRDFETVRGYITADYCAGGVEAFVPHSDSCTDPGAFRRPSVAKPKAAHRKPLQSGEVAGVQRGLAPELPEFEQTSLFSSERPLRHKEVFEAFG